MSEGNAKMSSMLGKRNEARRKAESKELFRQLLKSPHLVQQSKRHKETRSEQKRKAINDEY
jgi:hypothetical protein